MDQDEDMTDNIDDDSDASGVYVCLCGWMHIYVYVCIYTG